VIPGSLSHHRFLSLIKHGYTLALCGLASS
jgi:hypothetical protein